jgi:Putative sensor
MTSRLRLSSVLRTAGLDAGYLLLGLPLGIAIFTIAVTGLSLAAGLAITLLGIPVLLATLVVVRWLAVVERVRAAAVLGEPIAGAERTWSGGPWVRTRAAAGDPAAWRNVLWALLVLPLGTAGFTVAVAAWSTALGLLSSPLWMWAVPDPDDGAPVAFLDDPSPVYALLRVLAGLALVPLAYAVCRGMAVGTARLAQALLGDGRRRAGGALEARALRA